jgi:hypothetical protein
VRGFGPIRLGVIKIVTAELDMIETLRRALERSRSVLSQVGALPM